MQFTNPRVIFHYSNYSNIFYISFILSITRIETNHLLKNNLTFPMLVYNNTWRTPKLHDSSRQLFFFSPRHHPRKFPRAILCQVQIHTQVARKNINKPTIIPFKQPYIFQSIQLLTIPHPSSPPPPTVYTATCSKKDKNTFPIQSKIHASYLNAVFTVNDILQSDIGPGKQAWACIYCMHT